MMVSYRSLHFIHMGHAQTLHSVLVFDWVILGNTTSLCSKLALTRSLLEGHLPRYAPPQGRCYSAPCTTVLLHLEPLQDPGPIASSAQGTSRLDPGFYVGLDLLLLPLVPGESLLHPLLGLAAQALQGTR